MPMEDSTPTGEAPNPSQNDEMREMIQALLDKVDNLERQLGERNAQGTPASSTELGVPNVPAVPDGDDTGTPLPVIDESFDDDDGWTDYMADEPEDAMSPESATEPIPEPDSMTSMGAPSTAPVPPGYPVPPQGVTGTPTWGGATSQMPMPTYPNAEAVPAPAVPTPYVPYPAAPTPNGVSDPNGSPASPATGQPVPPAATPNIPPMTVQPTAKKVPWHGLSEHDLGKYGTGLVASLLIVMGIWIGAQMVWNQIPNLMKVAALLVIGATVETASAIRIMRSEDGSRNGFLTSLASTGAIASFLAFVIGGMIYNLYGPPPLGLMLIGWFIVQVNVARAIDSRLFYAVTYLGGALTLMLEGTQVASAPNAITATGFALTALAIPAVGLIDRNRNPAVPYASAGFSAVASAISLFLADGLLGSLDLWGTGMTADFAVSHPEVMILALAGFLSGCAVLAGSASLSKVRDTSHQVVSMCVGTLALILMLLTAHACPWATGVVPNVVFCVAAVLIAMATRNDDICLPLAVMTAFSLTQMLEGTEAWFTAIIGMPVSYAVPALLVACVLPLLPQASASRAHTASVLSFVGIAWLGTLTPKYADMGVAYAVPVTILATFACVATFRMSMRAIQADIDTGVPSDGTQPVGMSEAWRFRLELMRRLAPLMLAVMASWSFRPIVVATGNSALDSLIPCLMSVLAALHMCAGIGLGKGLGLPGTESETRPWSGIQGQDSWAGDNIMARTIRGWDIAVLGCAYVLALFARASWGTAPIWDDVTIPVIVGGVAYSLTMVVVPATLIAHAASRRSMGAVIGATVLSHVSLLFVARLWVLGNSGIIASCLSIALSLGFIVLGFKTHKRDIRMTGLVSMILFVVKIALFDISQAGNTGMNAMLLVGTGILCFAISFAYNRIDQIYGEVDEDEPVLESDAETWQAKPVATPYGVAPEAPYPYQPPMQAMPVDSTGYEVAEFVDMAQPPEEPDMFVDYVVPSSDEDNEYPESRE